jgi:hypothetical protein
MNPGTWQPYCKTRRLLPRLTSPSGEQKRESESRISRPHLRATELIQSRLSMEISGPAHGRLQGTNNHISYHSLIRQPLQLSIWMRICTLTDLIPVLRPKMSFTILCNSSDYCMVHPSRTPLKKVGEMGVSGRALWSCGGVADDSSSSIGDRSSMRPVHSVPWSYVLSAMTGCAEQGRGDRHALRRQTHHPWKGSPKTC